MKLPLKADPQKQPFTEWIIKWAKYLRNAHEGAYFHQNGRHTACNFTGDEPSPHGNSSSIPNMNTYYTENPWIPACKNIISNKS